MNDNYLIASDVCVIMPVFHDTPIKGTPPKENVEPLVIRLPGPVPYVSTKAIPYKYNATMIENRIEVPLVSPGVVSNIAEETTTLRSGRVRPPCSKRRSLCLPRLLWTRQLHLQFLWLLRTLVVQANLLRILIWTKS